MEIFRNDPSQSQPVQAPLFTGSVSSRRMVGEAQSRQVTTSLVSFAAGGRNLFHTHTYDQVLYITEGQGIVATDEEEIVVRAGDLILIPAGEKHWHGATPTTAMAHLAIGAPGTTEIVQ